MARASTTTDIFNVIGDDSRRAILDALAHGETVVGDLVSRLDLAQPQVSKHLKVLRDVDVVRCRHKGRHRLYSVNQQALEPLQTWLTRLTTEVNEHYDRLDDYLLHMQRTERHEQEQ